MERIYVPMTIGAVVGLTVMQQFEQLAELLPAGAPWWGALLLALVWIVPKLLGTYLDWLKQENAAKRVHDAEMADKQIAFDRERLDNELQVKTLEIEESKRVRETMGNIFGKIDDLSLMVAQLRVFDALRGDDDGK